VTVSNVDTWEDDGGYVGRERPAPRDEWPHAYLEGPGPIVPGGLDPCGVPVVADWPPRVAADVAAALGEHRAGWLSGYAAAGELGGGGAA
jgi:hypothetical protein